MKIALQFSGGKDSLVLLDLMRKHWDKMTVYYCNSGDAFPETKAIIDAVKSIVPHFVEVQGKKKEVEAEHGWSSDLVPASTTPFGCMVEEKKQTLIDRYSCCYLSLMKPLHDRMREDGIKVIIRGQRNSDFPKSPIKDGEVVDGFKIFYPLANYTETDIFEYLEKNDIPIPRFYTEGMTSGGDCMHCTAWVEHGQAKYLNKFHPKEAKIVFDRLKTINSMIKEQYAPLEALGV